MTIVCAVECCSSEEGSKDISFFSFPQQPELRKKWLNAIGRPHWIPIKRSAVCSKHFREPEDLWPKFASGRRQLRPDAVPNIALPNVEGMKTNNLKEDRSETGNSTEPVKTVTRDDRDEFSEDREHSTSTEEDDPSDKIRNNYNVIPRSTLRKKTSKKDSRSSSRRKPPYSNSSTGVSSSGDDNNSWGVLSTEDDDYEPITKKTKKKNLESRALGLTNGRGATNKEDAIGSAEVESVEDPDVGSDIEWMIDLIQKGENPQTDVASDQEVDVSEDERNVETDQTRVKSAAKNINILEDGRFLVVDVVKPEDHKNRKGMVNTKPNESTPADPMGYKWLFVAPSVKINPFQSHKILSIRQSVNKPIDYLKLFFTDEFLDLIIDGTNDCALQKDSKSWKILGVREFKRFLALLFGMGQIRMETFDDYWSTDPIFQVPGLSSLMPQKRFQEILKHLSFTKQNKQIGNRESSSSVAVTSFETRMNSINTPGATLRLWDPIILGGRTQGDQDFEKCSNKSELCILSESGNGLFLKAHLVRAKEGNDQLNGSQVAERLTHNFTGKWRRLYADEYYLSVKLVLDLLHRKIYCTGRVSPDCPDVPVVIKDVQLKKGQCTQTFLENGFCVVKWKKSSDIIMASSEFSGRLINMSQGKPAPEMYTHHEKTTKNDTLSERLKFIEHPCVKDLDWFEHLAIIVFEMILSNCWKFYNMRCEKPRLKMSLLEFRRAVMAALLDSNS